MEAALFIYAASFASRILDVLVIFSIFSIFLAVGLSVSLFLAKTEVLYEFEIERDGRTREEIRRDKIAMFEKPSKIAIIASSVFITLALVVPSERTMYLMAGAYIGQQALTSEVSKDLQDIVALQVKKYKNELQEQVK